MKSHGQRGSAMLVALIIAVVLLTATAGLYNTAFTELRSAYRSHLRSAAFYLAEAGLENAAQRIQAGEYNVDPSLGEETVHYFGEDDIALASNRTGRQRVVVRREPGTNFYTVQALGEVRMADGLTVMQAVQASFELLGGTGEESTAGGGGPGFAIAASDRVRFGFSNGTGVRVASYDSNANFGAPDWNYNSGYNAAVGVASAQDNRLELNNSYIRGTVRTGGGDPRIDYNARDENRSSRLQGPDTEKGVLFDPNRVARDYSDDFSSPVLPELGREWQRIEVDQNDNSYRNQRELSIGEAGKKIYLHLPYAFDTHNNGTLTIAGDVIIHLDRNMNLRGTLRLLSGATLTIFVEENAHVGIECGDWPPGNFRINATGNRDVQINNTSVFTGVIDAPNSTVRVNGNGGLPRTQIRGSVTARELETTQGVDFFYDVRLDGGSSSTADPEASAEEGLDLRREGWKQITPGTVTILLPAEYAL